MCTLHSLVMCDSKTFSQEVIESEEHSQAELLKHFHWTTNLSWMPLFCLCLSQVNYQPASPCVSEVYCLYPSRVHSNLILALGITNPPQQQHVAQVKWTERAYRAAWWICGPYSPGWRCTQAPGENCDHKEPFGPSLFVSRASHGVLDSSAL